MTNKEQLERIKTQHAEFHKLTEVDGWEKNQWLIGELWKMVGYIPWLIKRVEEVEAANGELREVLVGEGYHTPSKERCRHGMNHWVGDHCRYDMPALATTPQDKED